MVDENSGIESYGEKQTLKLRKQPLSVLHSGFMNRIAQIPKEASCLCCIPAQYIKYCVYIWVEHFRHASWTSILPEFMHDKITLLNNI